MLDARKYERSDIKTKGKFLFSFTINIISEKTTDTIVYNYTTK